MKPQNTLFLTPPLLSPDHIREKIACIRAHRERIFRVGIEVLKEKLIVHNYGHGGAGWTFLFGCVNEAVRQFQKQVPQNPKCAPKIKVIGAGCYGLLTAITLFKKGYDVSLVAHALEELPSGKAAGFFFPRARKCSTPQERAEFFARARESYQQYLNIIEGSHPFLKRGPKLVPAYFGPDIDPGFAPFIEEGLIEKPERVSISFGGSKIYDVLAYNIVFINPPVLMQELWCVFNECAIPIERREIRSFDEIQESIIFNCAGMGAKKLANDMRMVPVQGHLITLKNQPDVTALQYLLNVKVVMHDEHGRVRDELVYFAPNGEGILGITFLRGQSEASANQHEFERLLKRSRDFFG